MLCHHRALLSCDRPMCGLSQRTSRRPAASVPLPACDRWPESDDRDRRHVSLPPNTGPGTDAGAAPGRRRTGPLPAPLNVGSGCRYRYCVWRPWPCFSGLHLICGEFGPNVTRPLKRADSVRSASSGAVLLLRPSLGD